MHIPDGFISPKMYLPSYAVAAGLWFYASRRVKRHLNEDTIPSLAVMTALAFVLMMIAIPLPGGTSAHASGVALLGVLFGVWTAFLAISMVLLLQAFLFGIGGVTSFPVNAIAMGFFGSVTAVYGFKIFRSFHSGAALVLAGWLSITVPALLAAVALGLQTTLAHTTDGTPLFFPFGLRVTLPAVMIPHFFIGIGEGLLTLFVYRLTQRFLKGGAG
jgi:cobalt/nickel transport system permease protein